MNKIVILGLVLAGLFSPMILVKADVNPKLNRIHPLKTEEVNSIQVKRLSGGSRIFQINDGYIEGNKFLESLGARTKEENQ